MKAPFFIAFRYLFTKKSHSLINVISLISLLSVIICSGALFIILSIFNGLQNYVSQNFNSFNADIEISPKKGKTFILSEEKLQKIKQTEGIRYVSEVLTDIAVFAYEDRQFIGKIKGVYPDYFQLKRLDTMVFSGNFLLQISNMHAAVLGSGVANRLNCSVSAIINPSLTVYYPDRHKKTNLANPSKNLHIARITPFGVFASGTEYDASYVFVPIDFARDLMQYPEQITSLEIGVEQNVPLKPLIKKLQLLVGDAYYVKDAYQQEEELYKVMQAEKTAIYLILTFIFLVASFNIIGMIAILVLDKQRDINVLYSLGADNTFVKRVFMLEGMMISFSGAVIGLIIGLIFCWLQTRFHLIQFGDGSYMLNYYPVEIYIRDILLILVTIMAISFPATYIPVVKISERLFKNSTLR